MGWGEMPAFPDADREFPAVECPPTRTPRDWPENAYPTVEQLAGWLGRCTDPERLEFAGWALRWERECARHADECLRRNRNDGARRADALRTADLREDAMTDDAIVQAAAEALTYTAPNGELVLGWPDLRCEVSEWEREQLARAVLTAVEPLIRADQREKDAALIEGEAARGPGWATTGRSVARLVHEGTEPTPATSDRSSR